MNALIDYGRAVQEQLGLPAKDIIVHYINTAVLEPAYSPGAATTKGAKKIIRSKTVRRKTSTVASIRKPSLVIGDNTDVLKKAGKLLDKLVYQKSVFPFVRPVFSGNLTHSEVKIEEEEMYAMAIALVCEEKFAVRLGAKKNCMIIPALPYETLTHYVRYVTSIINKLADNTKNFEFVAVVKKNKLQWTWKNFGKFQTNFGGTGKNEMILLDLFSSIEQVGKIIRSTLIPETEVTNIFSPKEGTPTDPDVVKLLNLLKATNKEIPFYIYKSSGAVDILYCNPVIVNLALEGKLAQIVRGVHKTALSLEKHSQDYFRLVASRFCLLLNIQSFKEFLSIRTTYSSELKPLLYHFMKKENIPLNITEAAECFGKWISKQAYFAALDGRNPKSISKEERNALNKAIGSRLAELESAALNASSADDFLHKLMSRASRLTGQPCPPEASEFIAAALTGAITLEQTKHLALIFMRLRSEAAKEIDLTTEQE